MEWNELKEILDSKKIEVRELANDLEMTSNGLRECIKRDTIQLKKLRRLCEILHIHPNLFFDVQKGVYLNNVNAQVGNNNKIGLESKDREIEMLKERLHDKDEIIRMLREKLEIGIAAGPKPGYKKP